MIKICYAMLFCVAFTACGKTETRVVRDGTLPLPEPPQSRPEDPIPDVKNPGGDTIENDEVEAYALNDALSLNSQDALQTTYISAADFVNFKDDVRLAMRGTVLGLNLLSNRNFIESIRPVDPSKSIWAVDLRDFWGSKGLQNWRLIENQAVIKIVSQTVRFKNLQFLTQKRIPIMHAKIFLETAFKASVYYQLTDIPQLENDFWNLQGIDRQRDFDQRDREIFMAGFQESLIAPDHNRVVRRMEGNNGACWNTYDVDALAVVPENNFFQFPFPVEARSGLTFKHAAGEILCRKANGLMSMALYNGAGQRADFAPTTVVVNTRTAALGLDPSITLRDCVGCHTQFILPFQDEMREQIARSTFGPSDKVLGQIFFRPKAETDSAVARDNQDYAAALGQMGISSGGSNDPLNVGVIDKLRDGGESKEIAAFFYLSEEEFLSRLAASPRASQEVGALLRGGTIGFIGLQAAAQTIIDDLALFRDVN